MASSAYRLTGFVFIDWFLEVIDGALARITYRKTDEEFAEALSFLLIHGDSSL